MPVLSAIRTFIWGEVPSSKAEAKLLFKIDWFILSYCCLVYFTNYLDRSNVNNAYVSGMKEELSMVGTEFNKINTIFTCGYIVGMIPNNLMLQVVSPRIWLPVCQIVWGVLTFCTSAVQNVEQIYAIRFFQGVAESSTFVGTHYVLGSWYKSGELGKRSGIFTSSGLAGTLFSGVLQATSTAFQGEVAGAGYGVITLPIAFYGFLIFPDVPATTKAFYLSEKERTLAAERLQGQVEVVHAPLSWKLVKRVLGRWRWYGCSLLFAISGETESFGSNNLMGQFLKASTSPAYTVVQTDYYPAGVTAFGIASTLVCATWTDYTRVRWPVLVYMAIAGIVASVCLLVRNGGIGRGEGGGLVGLRFFAYYLAGASYAGQATTFAWANQICADDDQERAIVLASMNMWNNVVNAWWSIVFYPATDAPRFTKGMIAMIVICVATLGITWVVWYLERREHRIGQKQRLREGKVGDGDGDRAKVVHGASEQGSKHELGDGDGQERNAERGENEARASEGR